ncbi:hypothetical protein MKK84_29655 [Methylobacterium sp. E-065]|uniref:hypothetical protein n=1 Tax=Methylobacterium sp. E-065 TaxID=2836583 RepID=UPI001FBAF700|nr:hypothetical protein [Methylobacterium sp. E-065]MCJ2021535.1 hypothetical protein [Methylobacterium sp. E-065]
MALEPNFKRHSRQEENIDKTDPSGTIDATPDAKLEPNPEDANGKIKTRSGRSEINLWILFSIALFIYSMADITQSDRLYYPPVYIAAVLKASILSFVFLIIPYFFRQIFGDYPITYVSKSAKSEDRSPQIIGKTIIVSSAGDVSSTGPIGVSEANPRSLLEAHARNSAEIAQKIYNRAGVYLRAGAFIAFAGLGIFYAIPYNDASTNSHDLVDRFVGMLPRFGVLFFIEFVAIFFLRQYRSAMDDYRYYDAVRRHREENLAVLHMFGESKIGPIPTKEVLESMSIYSGVDLIGKDQTSTAIELRKLDRDELIFFEKMVEGLSAIRKERDEKDKKTKRDDKDDK